MVIGNNPQVALSLFAPQYTMAAVIANEFTEAADDLYLNALVEIGLVLFVITVVINGLSRLLIWSMGRVRECAAAGADGAPCRLTPSPPLSRPQAHVRGDDVPLRALRGDRPRPAAPSSCSSC